MKILASLLSFLVIAGASAFGQNDYFGGPIKATTHVYPDGSTSTTVTNPDKRTSEDTLRDAGGRLLRKIVYPLNDQNFARGAVHYDAKNVVIYKEVYVFDVSGRVVESKLFSKDNQPEGKRVFVYEGQVKARIEDYDKFGNLITPPSKSGSGKRRSMQ